MKDPEPKRKRRRYNAAQPCFNGHLHRTVRAMRACHQRDASWIVRVKRRA